MYAPRSGASRCMNFNLRLATSQPHNTYSHSELVTDIDANRQRDGQAKDVTMSDNADYCQIFSFKLAVIKNK